MFNRAMLFSSVPATLVSISDLQVSANSLSGGTAEASLNLNNDGTLTYDRQDSPGAGSVSGEWLRYGSPSAYEARATLVSGTLSSGTTGSWTSCGTTQGWTVSKTGTPNGAKQCTFTLEIRSASTLEVLDSASIQLSASVANEYP